MFAVTVELLAGRYVATAYNARDQVEWPPHPARLFSALIATWAASDPAAQEGVAELKALRWLEEQPPPVILASPTSAAGERQAVPVYVPVNDVNVVSPPSRGKLDEAEAALAGADGERAAKLQREVDRLRKKLQDDTAKAVAAPAKPGKHDGTRAEQVLLERRVKQPRTFPSAGPAHPGFAFVWETVEMPDEVRPALRRLLARLVRLGHSSSLVHGTLCEEAGALAGLAANTTRYSADPDDGELVIRWVAPGQVERLERAFALHQETEPRILPARFVRYREGERPARTTVARGVFGDDLVILARVDGPRLPGVACVGLSRTLRAALVAAAGEPVHEVLSGRRADGSSSERPHLAVVPLPFVMGPHPDGAVLGVALVLPRALAADERAAIMRAAGLLERAQAGAPGETPAISLALQDAGTLSLRRIDDIEDPRSTLQSFTWCRPSRRWASATPVALDRHPGNLYDSDPRRRQDAFAAAEASLRASCELLGLPPPVQVEVARSCVLPGTAKPRDYPRFPVDPARPERVLVHARLTFAEPVGGPLLLGAGRYQGLGLLLPVDERATRGVTV